MFELTLANLDKTSVGVYCSGARTYTYRQAIFASTGPTFASEPIFGATPPLAIKPSPYIWGTDNLTTLILRQCYESVTGQDERDGVGGGGYAPGRGSRLRGNDGVGGWEVLRRAQDERDGVGAHGRAPLRALRDRKRGGS